MQLDARYYTFHDSINLCFLKQSDQIEAIINTTNVQILVSKYNTVRMEN